MTGYVRKDTTNNIADGNVINAADLDSEFDGVQDAFNASTGHKHDGTAGEGATINALGPTQDVTVSATLVAPKTTNTVDIGSSALKFKDLFLAGNGSVGGTLAVTGVATLTAQPILSSLTASRAVFTDGSKGLVSNAITGTGNVVMSASPTLTGTVGGASLTLSSLTSGRVTYAGTSGLLQDDADLTFDGTTLSTAGLTASSTVTLSGGTANGVAYLNGSKVVTSGSALTFDGTNLTVNGGAVNLNYSGTNYASSAIVGLDYYFTTANGASIINNAVNSTHIWRNGGSEGMRLTSTGLGIGTSSPSYKLDVRGTGTQTIAIRTQTSGDAKLLFENAGSNSGSITYSRSGQSLLFSGQDATTHMTLTNGGNLGLGVTPSAWNSVIKAFQLGRVGNGIYGQTNNNTTNITSNAYFDSVGWKYGATDTASYYSQYAGAHTWYNAASGTAGNAITFTQAMTLDASGNLGVGTTTMSAPLHVRKDQTAATYIMADNVGTPAASTSAGFACAEGGSVQGFFRCLRDGTSEVQLYNVNNAALRFGTNNTEAARIDGSGKFLCGATSGASDRGTFASAQASMNTLGLASTDDASGGGYLIFRNSAYTLIGSVSRVSTTNAVVYNTTSDYRLKTVTGTVTGQGARIDALKPIDYQWAEGGQQARGFLAHEFQTIYPNSVTGAKDAVDEKGNPVYQGMQAGTAEVIADLVAEIQSLRKRLADAGI